MTIMAFVMSSFHVTLFSLIEILIIFKLRYIPIAIINIPTIKVAIRITIFMFMISMFKFLGNKK